MQSLQNMAAFAVKFKPDFRRRVSSAKRREKEGEMSVKTGRSRRISCVPSKRRNISSNCRRKENSETLFLDVEKYVGNSKSEGI